MVETSAEVEDYSIMTLEQGREYLKYADSYSRLGMVIEVAETMAEADWFTLLGEEWSSCDNISLLISDLSNTPFVWTRYAPERWRDAMMNTEERAAYAALPEQITVYRGCYQNNKWGLSWTLNRDTAERFPRLHRYWQPGQALLVKATVAKADVLALKGGRNEAEVICWRPKHVSTSHIRS